jgi:hypothetical protein
MKTRYLVVIILLFFCLIFLGCVTIPPEAPELSVELGNRISALEESNITLLHRYFDQKRNEVDRFIEQQWVPVFAEEFFSDPFISDAWDTIVTENNKSERLKFLIMTGPKLQAKINNKRLELIKPLDDLERRIEGELRNEYAQMRAINNALTSFLLSASKVTETRNRYLEMVKVTDKKIEKVINKTDNAVFDLLKKTRDVQDKTEAVEEYLDELRSIVDSI